MEENRPLKIGSLNVNQFLGDLVWENREEKYKIKEENVELYKVKIKGLINYINSEELDLDILFLNEIPYPSQKFKKILKKETETETVLKEFKNELDEINKYSIYYPSGAGSIITVVLIKNDFINNVNIGSLKGISNEEPKNYVYEGFTYYYNNKIIPLSLCFNNKNILLVGAHIPLASNKKGNDSNDKVKLTWFELKNIVDQVRKNILYENNALRKFDYVILMGDLNADKEGTVQRVGLNRVLNNNLMIDLWKEKHPADPRHITYVKDETYSRLDYILVDNQLNKDFNLQMEIDDSTRLKVEGEEKYYKLYNKCNPFTDHSALILKISEK